MLTCKENPLFLPLPPPHLIRNNHTECLGEANDCTIDGVCPEGSAVQQDSADDAVGAVDGSGDEGNDSVVDTTVDDGGEEGNDSVVRTVDGSGDEDDDLAVDLAGSSGGNTVACAAATAFVLPTLLSGVAVLL